MNFKNIKLSKGFKITKIQKDEEIFKGELTINNKYIENIITPYDITGLFEKEINKFKKIPEIIDVELNDVKTKLDEYNNFDFIVEFQAYTL